MLKMLFVVVMAMILMGIVCGSVKHVLAYSLHKITCCFLVCCGFYYNCSYRQVELAHGGRGNSSNDRYGGGGGRGQRGGGVSRRSDYRGMSYGLCGLHIVIHFISFICFDIFCLV